jgi:AcrR family transcriptional regulator
VATASSRFHAGLTADRIVDAALALTRDTHLYGWSLRDLARELAVAPSVIYHHVGGKDLLARRVIERALAPLTLPDAALGWREWFRVLLAGVYDVATPYPGTAKWALLHGPTFPSMVPVVDAGIAKLREAGFADRSAFAYSALLNTATLTISIGDERLLHDDDGPRDHAAMMAEFSRTGPGSPGVAALAGFMASFAEGGEAAATLRAAYYRDAVDVTIRGLADLLGDVPSAADPDARIEQ